MTLSEAAEVFIEQTKREANSGNRSINIGLRIYALELLKTYCSANSVKSLDDLTHEYVRDFMARWWVEESGTIREKIIQPSDPSQNKASDVLGLLDAVSDFFIWLDERGGARSITKRLAIIDELKQSLPLAFEIKESIQFHFTERAGPFGFPEFLTSFEEGGHSSTDALEGFFRVSRIDGLLIEAEELISETRVWPIFLPEETALLIRPGYILGLEIIRVENAWEIASSSFVYPPGTSVV